MSIDATKWAWEANVSSAAERIVLLSLADRAGEEHTAWPSYERLVKDTKLNIKTVNKVIAELITKGFLQDTGRRVGVTKSVKVLKLVGVNDRKAIQNTENAGNSTSNTQNGIASNNGSDSDLKNIDKTEGYNNEIGEDLGSNTQNGIAQNNSSDSDSGSAPIFGSTTENGMASTPKNGIPSNPKNGMQNLPKNLPKNLPINTGSERADDIGWKPELDHLNVRLKMAGLKPVTDEKLNQTLVEFNPYYETQTLNHNKKVAKLIGWLRTVQEREQLATAKLEAYAAKPGKSQYPAQQPPTVDIEHPRHEVFSGTTTYGDLMDAAQPGETYLQTYKRMFFPG